MPVIFCDVNLFSYNQPVMLADDEGNILQAYQFDIDELPQAICALAYKNGITNIKFRGQSLYIEPWINEIKTAYSLNYGQNDLEIEVY